MTTVQSVRNYEEFAKINNVTMKMKIMRMEIIKQIKTPKYQKTSKTIRMTQLKMLLHAERQ